MVQPVNTVLPSAVKAPAAPTGHRPGCTAADAALLVQGYLDGLARGNGGFGVLALGKTRLEEGAMAAETMGQADLGSQMREVASKLPGVRSPEAAEELAQQMRPVVDRAWHLGKGCRLASSSETVQRIRRLAKQVSSGEITEAAAVETLTKEDSDG